MGRPTKNMKALKLTLVLSLTTVLVLTPLFSTISAIGSARQRPIVLGQTEGWANGELTVFDYTQNFVCSNSPLNNADCLVGASSLLTITALTLDAATTLDLIVIVPFFDCTAITVSCPFDDPDTTLEALDLNPGVFVQCPETQSSTLNGGTAFGSFGHCILHDTALDTSPLAGVTVAGVTFGGVIPLPNHTHIVKDAPGGSVPWDIGVVLVTDSTIFPNADGLCTAGSGCLTSFDAIASAPAGSIVGPVATSLFLFFGVHGLHH